MSAGHGVAELQLAHCSGLAGSSIQDSGLRERYIVVLTLHRGTTVIPNPKVSRVMELGDRVPCFGKLESN